ncbi:MAG: hypothetical protein K8R24_07765, partial [Mycobacterium sp.]|nr:hypothetical protein [Mycobacterium sp.]
ALALGVGGAVAIGLAAQASAAPSEPSTPSVRAAAADTARSATGRVTTPTAHRRAAPSAAAAAPASAVPKPSAAAPRRVSLAVPVPAPDAAPAPVAQATPADIFSSLATRIAGIFGWDPRGRQITIYKGTHFAIPNSFGLFIRQAAGTGTFTADTVYDLGDADQFDWNKFSGIAFTPLEPDRDAAMVGWRYNLTSQEFEIAPFYNVNKARILPDERTEVISVPAGETFQFLVDYTGITLTYGDTTVYKPYPTGLTPNVWTAARVSGWFGGNEVAPKTVSYYLKLT